ncbi:SRSF protein kinase 3 [Anopheles moucheti]|uniref:SRSF protein kinase 3 n=1 Tax=Anopheles moucheti TaxID=186751 RepID=UPI0022F09C51|nr:SRSF protein kinase 3 [Anopheles moucheti]XP_052893211.1 SRSF protein kinase 3 [Anopheles moucheti]XP_052893212.1 SRSF protein kinase 3 [Anopheles moucheti]XP_052893213.1 SRSF protein kinase 3 [Anopheles moucheti]XP_052893214.1 SRSF protein kinase 3 [Anopheles moucheti]XP_052893215.1 SRSF protein kinase 3 [Anopheles moucheti]
MNIKPDTNRHVLTIQAKKKRHKTAKKKAKQQATAAVAAAAAAQAAAQNSNSYRSGQNHQSPATAASIGGGAFVGGGSELHEDDDEHDDMILGTTSGGGAVVVGGSVGVGVAMNDSQHSVSAVAVDTVRRGSKSAVHTVAALDATTSSSNETIEQDRDADGYTSEEEEQECREDYCRGGYHPVKLGDLFLQRYHVIRKLGWGHFSTVWLSWDLEEKRYVALKIVKSAQHFSETAKDEIHILKTILDADPTDTKRNKVVQLLNDFRITGVNGTHICMVFEVLGHNLLKLIMKSNYRGIPLANVKSIIRQVLEGLDYLHTKCKIIHTDIKPENVLVCVNESYVRKLACEATEMHAMGCKLPISLISAAPPQFQEQPMSQNMSKAKKKKMKRKAKMQSELIRLQMEHIQQLEFGNTVGMSSSTLGLLENGTDGTESGKAATTVGGNVDDVGGSAGMKGGRNVTTLCNTSTTATSTTTTTAGTTLNSPLERKEATETRRLLVNGTAGGGSKESAGDAGTPSSGEEDRPTLTPCASTLSSPSSSEATSSNNNDDISSDRKSPARSGGPDTEKEIDGDREHDPKSPDKPSSSSVHSGTSASKLDISESVRKILSSVQESKDPAFEVCDIDVKIADLGNACWVDKHFTDDIQTRQYRSLEVIIGAGFDTSADIWSTACMAFELATGDYLFEPFSGKDYCRDDDHIAHIIELLGPIPKRIALSGKNSSHAFNSKGLLKNISGLKPWGLVDVLIEKYEWPEEDAFEFSDFLKPMLDYDPRTRATAADCLRHSWLNH